MNELKQLAQDFPFATPCLGWDMLAESWYVMDFDERQFIAENAATPEEAIAAARAALNARVVTTEYAMQGDQLVQTSSRQGM